MSGIGGIGSNPYATLYSELDKTVKSSRNAPPGIKHAADPNEIQRLWDEAQSATESLRNIVAQMLGVRVGKAGMGQGYWAVRANPDQFNLKFDPEIVAEAQEMIGEDGYYGVKQTTARIVDFAKAMGGKNASADQIENLRKGVQEGFDAVAKIFGGFDNLPEVTKETYEAVMKAFDDWKAEAAG